MKIEVNKNKCLGCGMCVNMCPAVFEFKNNKSSVKKNSDLKKNFDCAKQAANLCPAQAIKVEK